MMLRVGILFALSMVSYPLWSSPLLSMIATDLIMARSHEKFPEAMLTLQESIAAHGYTVSRVQRIDIGLTGMGYKTDKYRIVFAGKIDYPRYRDVGARQLPDKLRLERDQLHVKLVIDQWQVP